MGHVFHGVFPSAIASDKLLVDGLFGDMGFPWLALTPVAEIGVCKRQKPLRLVLVVVRFHCLHRSICLRPYRGAPASRHVLYVAGSTQQIWLCCVTAASRAIARRATLCVKRLLDMHAVRAVRYPTRSRARVGAMAVYAKHREPSIASWTFASFHRGRNFARFPPAESRPLE